ncbi:hypothetical protein DRJ25_05025 [Candidatus Woesearchaeota archaeon]|nr:MAG: hypothetical protein DRJ25_05025 [Candidatus Woesearchaeota archaeon]
MSEDKKNRRLPFWKRWMMPAALLAAFIGGFFITTADNKNQERPKTEKTSETRINVRDVYLDWMVHYNPEGFTTTYLKEHSPTISRLFDEIEAHPEKAQELIGDPLNRFFSNPQKYEDYPTKLVMEPYCENQSEKATHELFKKLISTPGKMKGLEQIVNLIETNPQNFRKFDDEALSLWTLNAAYYLVRHNFKAYTMDKERFSEEARTERKANPEMTTILTYDLYCALLNKITEVSTDRRYLSEKVKIVTGYVLFQNDNKTGRGVWLEYSHEDGQKEIIETYSETDDDLAEQDFNPKKIYLKGRFKDVLYIPLIKTTLSPTGTKYTIKKTIHVLPPKIEKEIEKR